MTLTNHDRKRYARQISLPEIAIDGQEILKEAKVLIIGAGGLGSSVSLYLSLMGVGELGIVDGDKIELSNLHRQILFQESDISKFKSEISKEKLQQYNNSNIIAYNFNIDQSNIEDILDNYDLIVDCSDNFKTRFIINTACYKHKKILVSAAAIGFDAQISVFKGYDKSLPCYECFCKAKAGGREKETCMRGGVLPSLVATAANIASTEIIKELLSIGKSLAGEIIIYSALSSNFKKIKITKDSACRICGLDN